MIPDRGRQLGASLLALDLGRAGDQSKYVRGHYLRGDDLENDRNEHSWVEVGSNVLLDPTRDQFDGEDPFSDSWAGRYVRRESTPAASIESQVYAFLLIRWRVPALKSAVRLVVDEYGLDVDELANPACCSSAGEPDRV